MSEVTSIRLDADTKKRLEEMAEKYGISKNEIINYLINLAYENKLLEENWKEYILGEKLEEYKAKIEEDLRKDLEKEKFKTRMDFKYLMLKEYIKVLPEQERREFLEEHLPELNLPDFIDRLGEMELVKVDGKPKLVRMVDGVPVLNVAPERLVRCMEGWHIRGNYCKCKNWKTCNIRLEEIAKQKMGETV